MKTSVLHKDLNLFVLVAKLYRIVNYMKNNTFVHPKVRANEVHIFLCLIDNFQFQVLCC